MQASWVTWPVLKQILTTELNIFQELYKISETMFGGGKAITDNRFYGLSCSYPPGGDENKTILRFLIYSQW